MPLWDIVTSANALTKEDKQTIVDGITKIYTKVGLPAFYVVIRFSERSTGDLFVGGKYHPSHVVLQVYHLARNFASDEQKTGFLERVDKVLNPVMKGRGLDWEYTISESPRELWKSNGLVPPMPGTEMEKEWVRQNRPVAELGKF